MPCCNTGEAQCQNIPLAARRNAAQFGGQNNSFQFSGD
jgi:hypothetical protein